MKCKPSNHFGMINCYDPQVKGLNKSIFNSPRAFEMVRLLTIGIKVDTTSLV
jgi:hypothetical protein